MFTRTIDQAVRDSAERLTDRADVAWQEALDTANRKTDLFHRDVMERLDFATWAISGAIVAGLLAAAIIIRLGTGD